MYTVKVDGEQVNQHRDKEKAHNLANDEAIEHMNEYGFITVENYKGEELVRIMCDGWNVYTHKSWRR